MNNHIFMCS